MGLNMDKENKIGHFECACHDRDHMIRVSHYNWGPDDKYNHEIDFNFVVYKNCWEANENYYGDDNIVKEKLLDFTNFFRRIRWRISKAWEILLTGSLRFESDWSATPEGFEGLRKWMNKTTKLIKQEDGRIV